jgi:hypothetical protein
MCPLTRSRIASDFGQSRRDEPHSVLAESNSEVLGGLLHSVRRVRRLCVRPPIRLLQLGRPVTVLTGLDRLKLHRGMTHIQVDRESR